MQLVTESTPTQAGEYDGQKDQKDRSDRKSYVYLFVSILMGGLSILCITKGLYRGGYLGGGIILIGLPLLAVGVCSFFYGFFGLSFP
jgi:hypothetical protein